MVRNSASSCSIPSVYLDRDLIITCSNNTIDTVCYGRDNGGHGVAVGSGAQCSGSWWQWGLDEGGRVEPPLDSHDNETHSAGIAIDFTCQEPIIISETNS